MEGLSWRPGRPGAGGREREKREGEGGGREGEEGEECVSSRDGCSVSILHSFGLGISR